MPRSLLFESKNALVVIRVCNFKILMWRILSKNAERKETKKDFLQFYKKILQKLNP